MKPSLLPHLACPACSGDLALAGAAETEVEIEEGGLRCVSCAREYAIVRGVPRLGGVAAQPEEARKTVARFGWQWREFRERLPEYRAAFLDWVLPLTEADFAGKLVLDAGCGMGRFSEVAASMGAAVVAADLSDSLEVVQQIARGRENLHAVQADLLHLPFRRCFDLVYTLGVLHHLPDGEEGFRSLLRCVRPGGTIHVWVYGREGNEWLLRWVDPVRRALTSRLPLPVLRSLAWLVAAPLHAALVLLYRRASRLPVRLPYAPYLTWLSGFPFRHTHQVVFDHLGAPIAHYYRREELAGWFERARLEGVVISSRNANSWRGTARVPA
jgi:SAM-dependent methyltransferase